MDTRSQQVVRDLQEIIRLAGEVARAGGAADELGVRNRATEIAAMAETVVFHVDPAAAEFNLELYEQARGVGQNGSPHEHLDAQAPSPQGPPAQA